MKRLLVDCETKEIPVPNNQDYLLSLPSFDVISLKWNKRRVLKKYRNQSGYLSVKMENKTVPIHRIVASCFLGPALGRDVNHIDGNKLNNNPDNLEYVTRSENIEHSLSNGLHTAPRTPVLCYNSSNTGYWFRSQAEVKVFGFQQQNVNKVLKGSRKTSGGYYWEYV